MSFQVAQALAHFVWQGVIIGAVLFGVLQLLREPSARYNACACALALMCASPVVTFFYLAPHASSLSGVRGVLLDTALPASGMVVPNWFEAHATRLFWLWLAGALLLMIRAALAWWRARRVVTTGFEPLASGMEVLARRLAALMGANGVQFRVSARVASALVFGWIKPIIVLPAAALGRLTEAEIEALLAHELAHVLRCDFLINLLQTVAECVLFYQPMVWWVSARMREERELCCDDIAVAVCRDEVLYSKALLRLEELRMEPALAATGGRLALRIRRLLVGQESSRIAVAPALAFVLVFGVSVALLAQNAPPAPPAPPEPPAAVEPIAPLPPFVDSDGTIFTPHREGGDISSAPLPLHRVRPEYTKEARVARLEGSTFLSVVISSDGIPEDIKIVRSLDRGLDQKAVEAARKWRFQPALKSGKPVAMRANIEMNFRLSDDPPLPPIAPLPPALVIAPMPAVAPIASPRPTLSALPIVPVPAVAPLPPEPAVVGEVMPTPPAPPAPPSHEVVQGTAAEIRSDVKGPTGQAELKRRRAFAAERFGGESTDRGKAYVHYGPPDEIESSQNQGKGTEIWRYRDSTNKHFTIELEFRDGKQVRSSGEAATPRAEKP